MRLRSRQRGQSVVEFGILALLFALMMFAIVEFGLLLNGWVSVSSTAREAARWAATGLHVARGSSTVDGVYEKILHGQSPPGVPSGTQQVQVQYQSATVNWICSATPLSAPTPCHEQSGGWPDVQPQDFPQLANPPVPVGATVTVSLVADKYEIITPLVRPIFGCDGTVPHCWIPIKSLDAMYYEGPR